MKSKNMKKIFLLQEPKLADHVLTAKQSNPQAGTSALEGEIDQLVAPRQLYGLSEDEVHIVEERS